MSQWGDTTIQFSIKTRTIGGILKIVEIVFALISFSCAVTVEHSYWGDTRSVYGWTCFVGISGIVIAVTDLVLHLIYTKQWSRGAVIVELLTYSVWTVAFMIAGIVAAVYASETYTTEKASAASSFAFFAMVAWGIDTYFQGFGQRLIPTDKTALTPAPGMDTATAKSAEAGALEY